MRRVCPVLPALFLYTARYPVFGKSWGYASDMLEKYSKTLTEQADIMFKDVLTAEINNYTENDDFMIRKAGPNAPLFTGHPGTPIFRII